MQRRAFLEKLMAGLVLASVDRARGGESRAVGSLASTHHLGWWHRVAGIEGHDPERGAGVRIGIADTGVGLHPALAHIDAGCAFVHGTHYPATGLDVGTHGTSVAGIVGARPAMPAHYPGFAPGAQIFSARIHAEGHRGEPRLAEPSDAALAIDWLSRECQVDLINLSLASDVESAVLHQAIVRACDRGTLCICAAGNEGRSHVSYPARYPEAVAVGAAGFLEKHEVEGFPGNPAKLSPGGLYLCSESNHGVGLDCVGPGLDVFAPVPGRASHLSSFTKQRGTSIAGAAVCGILASLLSKHDDYRAMPRNRLRSERARSVLAKSCRDLELDRKYQGWGLPKL